MKIRYLVSWADMYSAGDPSMGILDIPDATAREYIKRGWAEAIIPAKCPHCGKAIDSAVLETATASTGEEQAVLARGGRR